MSEHTGPDLRATAVETARQTRAVLAALDDPAGDLTATPATRNRLQGAALALDALAGQPAVAAVGSPSSTR